MHHPTRAILLAALRLIYVVVTCVLALIYVTDLIS
jgi:hypothetical protein